MMAWNDKIAQIPQIPWGPDNHPAPFAPEMKACYKVSAKLSDAAGNDQISKTITTDLFISATQWINPGW
jgi:hypothetical protein